MESSKDSNALVSRIKELYKDDEKAFEKDYNTIVLHHKVKKINVKHEILKSVSEALHTDASTISEVYAGKRVTELFTVFCSRIVDSALNGKAFITTRREYMQVCEEICKRISPAKYEPDYNSFNLLYSSNGLSADIMRSREYKQLKSCNLTLERITQHISWEMYYQNIRRHYLEDANDSIIKQTEDVAFQNHADVVEELKDEGIDTPVKRLIKTKEKPISTLTNEYSRWGTYIYLTGDAVNNQISWEDEDGI